MPISTETNTRASHHKVVITKQGAEQHPGQSNVQAHGTKQTSTLGPAFGMRFYHFHATGCAAGAWTSIVLTFQRLHKFEVHIFERMLDWLDVADLRAGGDQCL